MRPTKLLFFIFAGGAYGLLPRVSDAPQVQEAATPLEYMRELYYQMYTPNGTVRWDETSLSTDVWCISDRGKYLPEKRIPTRQPKLVTCMFYTSSYFH